MTSSAVSTRPFDRLMSATGPASGGVVMATGIVAVALSSDHRHTVSLVLLAIAGFVWAALGSALAWAIVHDRSRFGGEARSPAALTAVAGTGVLGEGAIDVGWGGVAVAALVLAAVLWLALLGPTLRRWKPPAAGVWFMLTVSTQSLSVVTAQLARRDHSAWLLYPAVALLVLGLALYVRVLVAFELRQLVVGAGDHWVSGGALAISTLAAANVTLGIRSLHTLGGTGEPLKGLVLVLWALSVAWLPALLAGEIIHPRLSYNVRRWATVFPVGMYAACSFDAAPAARAPGLAKFAEVWVWVALALWLTVFAAMLWNGRELVRGAGETLAFSPSDPPGED